MKKALIFLFAISLVFPLAAQVPPGAKRNAALRYWNAFSTMSDQTLSDNDAKRLEAIANTTMPWDEQAFGEFLDANSTAVEVMVRGTALPYCDWGVEYEQGAVASIPQVGRGRALARLNALTAQRLAARGESHAAALHVVAGVRFSRDLAQGMPLIGALAGKLALLSTLKTAAAIAPQLSPEDRVIILNSLQALPAGVFDWGGSLQIESATVRDALARGSQIYKEMGIQGPRPTSAQVAELKLIMNDAVRLLRSNSAQTESELSALDERAKTLGPAIASITPSFKRAYNQRQQTESARLALIQQLHTMLPSHR